MPKQAIKAKAKSGGTIHVLHDQTQRNVWGMRSTQLIPWRSHTTHRHNALQLRSKWKSNPHGYANSRNIFIFSNSYILETSPFFIYIFKQSKTKSNAHHLEKWGKLVGRGGGREMGNTASFSPHSGLLTHRIYSRKQKYSFSGNQPKKDEMF